MNDVQKAGNTGPSLLQSLSYTVLIQPMQYVYRQWKIAMGTLPSSSTDVRASMENEIDALVRLFEAKAGNDLQTFTTHNALWHTGIPVDLRTAANLKRGRPWEWDRLHAVVRERSKAQGLTTGAAPDHRQAAESAGTSCPTNEG